MAFSSTLLRNVTIQLFSDSTQLARNVRPGYKSQIGQGMLAPFCHILEKMSKCTSMRQEISSLVPPIIDSGSDPNLHSPKRKRTCCRNVSNSHCPARWHGPYFFPRISGKPVPWESIWSTEWQVLWTLMCRSAFRAPTKCQAKIRRLICTSRNPLSFWLVFSFSLRINSLSARVNASNVHERAHLMRSFVWN